MWLQLCSWTVGQWLGSKTIWASCRWTWNSVQVMHYICLGTRLMMKYSTTTHGTNQQTIHWLTDKKCTGTGLIPRLSHTGMKIGKWKWERAWDISSHEKCHRQREVYHNIMGKYKSKFVYFYAYWNKSDISYLKTSWAFDVQIYSRALLAAVVCWLATP